MSVQKLLKRLKNNTKDLDDFILALSPGKESQVLFKYFSEEGFNFKPVTIILDDYSKLVKNTNKVESEIKMENVFQYSPKRPKFKYDVIVRYHLIKEGLKEKKNIVIGENTKERFIKLFYYFINGSLQKIYYLKESYEISGIKIINPLHDFTEEEVLELVDYYEINFVSNPYKEMDEEYRKIEKIYNIVREMRGDFDNTFFKGKIRRFYKQVNIEIKKCERCGIDSVTRICDYCSIRNEILGEMKKYEMEKPKKPRRLKPRLGWRIER